VGVRRLTNDARKVKKFPGQIESGELSAEPKQVEANRAQPPSRLPKAPEGLGLYDGEHGSIF
jgi:hypothetical protein